MFVLESDITIGQFRFSGVNDVRISKSIHGIVDSALIKIPSIARVVKGGNTNPNPVITGKQFNNGDPVVIKLGYNGVLHTEFVGFVKRRNLNMPLEATQKPHSLQWYVTMAKAFQFGITLPPDTDVYAMVPPADPTVLVVQYAAAVELINLIRIKVARLSGGVLAPLTTPQLTAFIAYMGRVKDAGVRLQITSGDPDNLRLQVAVFYDPPVLDTAGRRLDGTSATPVKDAINTFLDNLPFNGLFVLNNLIGALQGIDGVRIAEVVSAQANYGITAFVPIAYEYLPDAGYMVLDATYFDANVSYTAHGPI